MPELGLNPTDPVRVEMERISREEEWKRRSREQLPGWRHAFRRWRFCRRGEHRAVLSWHPDRAYVFCLDCVSQVRVGGPTRDWYGG